MVSKEERMEASAAQRKLRCEASESQDAAEPMLQEPDAEPSTERSKVPAVCAGIRR